MTRNRATIVLVDLALVLASPIALVVAGGPGVLGVLAGFGIGILFFASTPAVLGPVATHSVRASLPAALVFFATKVVAVAALFAVLSGASGLDRVVDRKALGLMLLVTTFTWMAGRIVDAFRQGPPISDLPASRPGIADRFEQR